MISELIDDVAGWSDAAIDARLREVELESRRLEAERAGADRLRGDVLVALARADVDVGDTAAADRRVRQAQAVFDRVGASEVEYAALDGVAGLAALAAGEPDRAEQGLREAIARVAAASDAGEPRAPVELAELRTQLGVALRQLGLHDGARVELDGARAAWIELYGPQHPWIATVGFELARLDAAEGRDAEALAGYVEVLDTFSRAYGPSSLDVGQVSEAMAVSLGRLGRYDEALRRHQQARAIFRAKLGKDRLDRLASVELARALDHEGLIRRELQQLDEALSLHQQALQMLARDGSQSPARRRDRARALVHLGEVLLDLERAGDARELLDEARQLLVAGDQGALELRAQAHYAAARAWSSEPEPDRKHARALAVLAREDFLAVGDRAGAAEVDGWLVSPVGAVEPVPIPVPAG